MRGYGGLLSSAEDLAGIGLLIRMDPWQKTSELNSNIFQIYHGIGNKDYGDT
jgi:hypothetical protein